MLEYHLCDVRTHDDTEKDGGEWRTRLKLLFLEEYDSGTSCFQFFSNLSNDSFRETFHYCMLMFL